MSRCGFAGQLTSTEIRLGSMSFLELRTLRQKAVAVVGALCTLVGFATLAPLPAQAVTNYSVTVVATGGAAIANSYLEHRSCIAHTSTGRTVAPTLPMLNSR